MLKSTVEDIEELAKNANPEQLAVLERTLAGDSRKGVIAALSRARHRIEAAERENARIEQMYSYEESLLEDLSMKSEGFIIGADEVGRGPIAGPVAVCAIALPRTPRILGLNDSKKLPPSTRESIAIQIEQTAISFHIEFVDAKTIDAIGIMGALKQAFNCAITKVEKDIGGSDIVLIDGNPLYIHPKETNIIKGDSKSASIAAASILAKVRRDALMDEISKQYPQYGFDSNKGYGTEPHRQAIKEFGLTDIHRRSFCSEFLQDSLF